MTVVYITRQRAYTNSEVICGKRQPQLARLMKPESILLTQIDIKHGISTGHLENIAWRSLPLAVPSWPFTLLLLSVSLQLTLNHCLAGSIRASLESLAVKATQGWKGGVASCSLDLDGNKRFQSVSPIVFMCKYAYLNYVFLDVVNCSSFYA